MDYSQQTNLFGYMKELSAQAGTIMLHARENGFKRGLKDEGGVVTSVDLRIRELVREGLAKNFPEVGLLTEESEDDLSRLTKEDVVIIDEMDGSSSFAGGREHYSFMISCVSNGVPILGLIHEPQYQRTIWAQEDNGVYLIEGDEERMLTTPPITTFDFKASQSRNHGNRTGEVYAKLGLNESRIVYSESMGTMMRRLMLGEAHFLAAFTTHLKEWDVAAGEIILREMGFSIRDTEGERLSYNQKNPNLKKGVIMIHPDIRYFVLQRI
jgi:fructose-1,6-bisphosphatase/inositol monophosphatase family enzyme